MFSLPRTRARSRIRSISAVLLLTAVSSATTGSAAASPGYQPDPLSIALGGEYPHGIAIDQVSQDLYVAELTTDAPNLGHGQIEQLTGSGVPTANSPFVTGAKDIFTGVAVNPVTQGIYSYQTQLSTPIGILGISQMNIFSSTGSPGGSFTPSKSTAPQLASDAAGRVYFPNDSTATVQVFDSGGTLKESISCAVCAGGPFGMLTGVALDSAGNLYAVDLNGGGRVVKFKPSGGSFAYNSVLQSGEGAVAVGVDPSDDDVFVGDLDNDIYHVVAYDSAGAQFDDFGGGVIGGPPFGIETSGQIAANATTHKVYVSDPQAQKVWIFDRIASIPAPTATTAAPTSVGQLGATLKATVNPNGHGLRDCHFEYTDAADFQANEFANATSVPCSPKPYGSTSVPAQARLDGLTPATAYDYRIAIASNGGSAKGTAQAFETLPPLPPTVTTGSASLVTTTSATIAGSVNAHGGPISNCRLQHTDETSFQEDGFSGAASNTCVPNPDGTTAVSVSAKLTGLVAGTSYRFRVIATNNSGTAEATDNAFATQAETCATNPALCPAPPPEETPAAAVLPSPVSQLPGPSNPQAKPLKCRKGFKKKRVHGKPKCVKIKKKKANHHAG
jgi:hypothetical protein